MGTTTFSGPVVSTMVFNLHQLSLMICLQLQRAQVELSLLDALKALRQQVMVQET